MRTFGNFAITCFSTSPSVTGLPSLPADEKSSAPSVKFSVMSGVVWTAGAMRGPADHVDARGACALGVGASDGNASSDSVSRDAGAEGPPLRFGRAGELLPSAGNGSGVPSSSCLF